jgi:hypothetical protein
MAGDQRHAWRLSTFPPAVTVPWLTDSGRKPTPSRAAKPNGVAEWNKHEADLGEVLPGSREEVAAVGARNHSSSPTPDGTLGLGVADLVNAGQCGRRKSGWTTANQCSHPMSMERTHRI